jgi:hypothetical protein
MNMDEVRLKPKNNRAPPLIGINSIKHENSCMSWYLPAISARRLRAHRRLWEVNTRTSHRGIVIAL